MSNFKNYLALLLHDIKVGGPFFDIVMGLATILVSGLLIRSGASSFITYPLYLYGVFLIFLGVWREFKGR